MASSNPPPTHDDPQPPGFFSLLRSFLFSTSRRDQFVRQAAWKSELSELQAKNRSLKTKLEEEKAEREYSSVAIAAVNEKLNNTLKEMQNRELKVEDWNRKLIGDACEAIKESASDLNRVCAENRELMMDLYNKLKAMESELEETKRKNEERTREMIRVNEALKGELAVKVRDVEMLVKENEILQVENKRFEALKVELTTKERELELVVKKEILEEVKKSLEALKGELVEKEKDLAMVVKEMEERLQEGSRSTELKKSHARLDHSNVVEGGSDGRGSCMIETEIESAAAIIPSTQRQALNSKIAVVLPSDGGENEDGDNRPLSEFFKTKRKRHGADMLSRRIKQQRVVDHMLLENQSKSPVTSLPEESPCKTDQNPALQAAGRIQSLMKQAETKRDVFRNEEEILISCQKKKSMKEKPWASKLELRSAIESDPRLCLKAICALYRQHKLVGLTTTDGSLPPPPGFRSKYASRGVALAEYLINRDPEGRMTRSMSEFERYHSGGIEQCRFIVGKHKSEVLEIQNRDLDPYFP